MVPEPRHQESLRGRWQQLRKFGLAKPHHDHPGAGDAVFRAPGRADAAKERLDRRHRCRAITRIWEKQCLLVVVEMELWVDDLPLCRGIHRSMELQRDVAVLPRRVGVALAVEHFESADQAAAGFAWANHGVDITALGG